MAAVLTAAGPTWAQSFIDGGGIAVGAQALYWTRSDPQAAPGGAAVFGPQNLHLDWEPGAEFSLGIQDSDSPWGMDLRYFWIEQFEDDATLTLPIRVNDRNPNIGIGLESFLQGAECSATYRANDWLLLSTGFRWIELTETFTQDLSLPGFGVVFGESTHVRNQLAGWQAGANVRLIDLGNFTTNLIGKVGLYNNWKTSGDDLVVAGVLTSTQDSDARLAFSSDARLQSELWLTSYLSVVGGYQVLFLDGVLRGETFALTGTHQAGANDSILYHGGFLGINLYR